METVLAVLMGVSLAAACGFRVFVPMLVLSLAAKAGWVGVASNLSWIGSNEALIALGTASVLEVVAYKVPWLDHALDTLATPAAVVAGTIVAASQTGQISFNGNSGGAMMQWGLARFAGGVAAGAVQVASVTTRAASTALTGGVINPFISAGESVLSVGASVLAIVAPVVAALLLVVGVVTGVVVVRRILKARAARAMAAQRVALAGAVHSAVA